MALEFDIESVEAEYRAGQLSLRKIAEIHGISESYVRKIAKENGWERDLTERVREAVRNKTVRKAVRTAAGETALSEEEIVERVGERGAEVLGRQGRVAGHGVAGAELMASQSLAMLTEIGSGDPPKTMRDKLQQLALSERAGKQLLLSVDILTKAAAVERLALGIEDKRGSGGEDSGSTVNVYQIPSNGRD